MKIPPFISAAIQRFITANPVWAKRGQAVIFIVGVLAWLPELCQYLGIPQAAWMETLHNVFVKVGSLLGLVLLQYPNAKSADEGNPNEPTVGGRPNDRNP